MSSAGDKARRRRAEQRRGRLTVARTTLDAANALGPFGTEGMALAWRLSVAAHALAGVEMMPRDMPVRVVLRSRSS